MVREAMYEMVDDTLRVPGASKENRNLPSDPTTLPRHELMVGIDVPGLKEVMDELNVDEELGLRHQANLTSKKALEMDIDELTSSNDYHEVSKALVERLFGLSKIKMDCFFTNALSAIKGFFKAGVLPISIHIGMLLLIYPMILYSTWVYKVEASNMIYFLRTLNIISWCGMGTFLVLGFALWSDRSIYYPKISVSIKSVKLSEVTERIPYGAKLKVLEAKKTGIFEDFAYVHPKFEVEHVRKEFKYPSVDPAILGVTKDSRMYMIVYWDIDNDRERVIKEIKHFKKYKL